MSSADNMPHQVAVSLLETLRGQGYLVTRVRVGEVEVDLVDLEASRTEYRATHNPEFEPPKSNLEKLATSYGFGQRGLHPEDD